MDVNTAGRADHPHQPALMDRDVAAKQRVVIDPVGEKRVVIEGRSDEFPWTVTRCANSPIASASAR